MREGEHHKYLCIYFRSMKEEIMNAIHSLCAVMGILVFSNGDSFMILLPLYFEIFVEEEFIILDSNDNDLFVFFFFLFNQENFCSQSEVIESYKQHAFFFSKYVYGSIYFTC